ncbi:class I SAM-dependent methyltransferase [Marinoscillum pacificum]|uniref:class I SAM-dependent methyltransferase n=1 Tax=Marinoscillum pacificum TaxID=392723 RepID=UPI00215772A0|nr:class I SAM-dependent methyltransferase [Marinoscillum pacificum]
MSLEENEVRKTYERLADSYNELIDHKPHNAYYDRPNTLSLLPENLEGKQVLDAACGPGKYDEELIKKGAIITGFDLSPKMIDFAKVRNPKAGSFFVHSLTEPFTMLENATFDHIVCALALEYVEDWSLTMQEFHRVLKQNGTLVISITHPFFDFNFFKSKDYFQTEHVKCTWTGFREPIEMNSIRRSLTDCITPFVQNGFVIDQLLEPRPTQEMKELDPRHYEELSKFPSFLCIRAVKR